MLPDAMAVHSRLTDDDARFAARAFGKLWEDETIGSRTSWAVLRGNATGIMGFERIDAGSDEQTPGARSTAAGRVWVLRLTAVRDDKVVSLEDLAILPGRTANVTVRVGPAGDQKLHYLIATSAGPQPRAAIWAYFETRTEGVVATVGRDVQLKPGEAVSAGRIAVPGGNYDLRVAFADTPFQAGADVSRPSTTLPVRGKGTL
jgi:hypothetical protein